MKAAGATVAVERNSPKKTSKLGKEVSPQPACGAQHNLTIVAASPTALLFFSACFILLHPRPWYLSQYACVMSFRTSLNSFFVPHKVSKSTSTPMLSLINLKSIIFETNKTKA